MGDGIGFGIGIHRPGEPLAVFHQHLPFPFQPFQGHAAPRHGLFDELTQIHHRRGEQAPFQLLPRQRLHTEPSAHAGGVQPYRFPATAQNLIYPLQLRDDLGRRERLRQIFPRSMFRQVDGHHLPAMGICHSGKVQRFLLATHLAVDIEEHPL